MIDRVARAMCIADGMNPDHLPNEDYADGHEVQWMLYRNMAKAAIKAMREPTDDMLRACWTNHHPWRENAPPPEDRQMPFNEMCEQVKADWQDMIDAALNPPANT